MLDLVPCGALQTWLGAHRFHHTLQAGGAALVEFETRLLRVVPEKKGQKSADSFLARRAVRPPLAPALRLPGLFQGTLLRLSHLRKKRFLDYIG